MSDLIGNKKFSLKMNQLEEDQRDAIHRQQETSDQPHQMVALDAADDRKDEVRASHGDKDAPQHQQISLPSHEQGLFEFSSI